MFLPLPTRGTAPTSWPVSQLSQGRTHARASPSSATSPSATFRWVCQGRKRLKKIQKSLDLMSFDLEHYLSASTFLWTKCAKYEHIMSLIWLKYKHYNRKWKLLVCRFFKKISSWKVWQQKIWMKKQVKLHLTMTSHGQSYGTE